MLSSVLLNYKKDHIRLEECRDMVGRSSAGPGDNAGSGLTLRLHREQRSDGAISSRPSLGTQVGKCVRQQPKVHCVLR